MKRLPMEACSAGRFPTIARYVGKVAAGDEQSPLSADQAEAGDEGAIFSEFADDSGMKPILEGFVSRLAPQVLAVREAFVERRWADVQRTAHQLKGAGGSYGYPVLSDAAKVLEDAAKRQDGPAATSALDRLADICAAIQQGHSQRVSTEKSAR